MVPVGIVLFIGLECLFGGLGSLVTPTHTASLTDPEPYNVGAGVGLLVGVVVWLLVMVVLPVVLTRPRPVGCQYCDKPGCDGTRHIPRVG